MEVFGVTGLTLGLYLLKGLEFWYIQGIPLLVIDVLGSGLVAFYVEGPRVHAKPPIPLASGIKVGAYAYTDPIQYLNV